MSYESETALYLIARGGGWNWTFSGSACYINLRVRSVVGNSGFRVVKDVEPSDRGGRGGCWGTDSDFLSSSLRGGDYPSVESDINGFRVVKDVKPLDCVYRGGSWFSPAVNCRSASTAGWRCSQSRRGWNSRSIRSGYSPSYRSIDLGFRVVKEINNDK